MIKSSRIVARKQNKTSKQQRKCNAQYSNGNNLGVLLWFKIENLVWFCHFVWTIHMHAHVHISKEEVWQNDSPVL